MPNKDYFFPDKDREPHIHVHKGGVTFTNTKHHHRDLVSGDKVRSNTVREVIEDLTAEGGDRADAIIKWINKNIDYERR